MLHRFGVFEFDRSAMELRKNGRAVALEPQPSRALAMLLARAGEVVSRDELKAAVWGSETHVDFDRGLAYCVSQIRSALGDSGENPRFVETLPKRGYRFIAPTSSADSTGSVQRWVIAALVLLALAGAAWSLQGRLAAPTARVVVAVSIFDNETGDDQYDRLVSGLSDLVVTHFTEMDSSRLAVIGNAAVLRQPRNIRNLKAVAAGLKADYLVLGQLQRADTGFRFITHLIRLSDETHLKANRLQMPDGNVSGLETAVVAEFDRAIREHVLPRASS